MSLKLYSGGKSQVGGQSLIRLNVVNAQYYKPSPSDSYYEFPWFYTTIIPITNWSRTWLKTQRVGPDGVAWKMMPENEEADVTFTSLTYQHYSADVVPEKFKANIILTTSTTNANLATDVPEVCVGQRVTFALTNLPMSQVKNITGTWKLPQKFVNQPLKYSATCTNYVRNNNLLRDTNAVSCWFVNGTGGPVSVGLNLLFTNDQAVSVAAVGNFKVVKPTIDHVTNSCSGVNMFLTNGSLEQIALQYTNQDNGLEMKVYVKRPDHFSGKALITQLVNRNFHWNANPLGITGSDVTGGYWLDAEDPFGNSSIQLALTTGSGSPANPVQPVYLHDGPLLGSPAFGFYNSADAQDDFRDYVRFQPDGGIPITIGRIDWGWHGKAVKSSGSWSLVVSTSYINQPDTSDDSFPTWTDVYHGTADN